MAVVALGLVMGSERTCISPEVEESVHHFWEMLGYLANTVLFVLVGIIISVGYSVAISLLIPNPHPHGSDL
jgi:sodium/hydrogen exchanger 10/11